MKVCKKCKKQVANKSKICRFCGADVSNAKIIKTDNNKKNNTNKNVNKPKQSVKKEEVKETKQIEKELETKTIEQVEIPKEIIPKTNPEISEELSKEKKEILKGLKNKLGIIKNKTKDKAVNTKNKLKREKKDEETKQENKLKRKQKRKEIKNKIKERFISFNVDRKIKKEVRKNKRLKKKEEKLTSEEYIEKQKNKEIKKEEKQKNKEIKKEEKQKNKENKKLLKEQKELESIEKAYNKKNAKEKNKDKDIKFKDKTRELVDTGKQKVINSKAARNKKVRVFAKIIIVLGLMILIAGISIYFINKTSPQTVSVIKGEEATNDKIFSTGDLINYKGVSYKVASVRTSTGNSYSTPKDGNIYLIITIYIINNTDHKVDYSYNGWILSDSKNRNVKKVFSSINVEDALYSGKLDKGITKRGSIIYEQSKKAKDMRLSFYEVTINQDKEETIDYKKKIFSVNIDMPKEVDEKETKSKK